MQEAIAAAGADPASWLPLFMAKNGAVDGRPHSNLLET
jgi:hypothetical protein